MGFAKYFARKGAIGGTARWVADFFFHAYANQIIDVSNCSTKSGLRNEIDKVVKYSIQWRYPEHNSGAAIQEFYDKSWQKGLLGFTIAILHVEARYYNNTLENIKMFDEVILEELRKKNVGEAMIFGELIK